MAEIITGALLVIVILGSCGMLIASQKGVETTEEQRKMLVRILISSLVLFALQLIPAELFQRADAALFTSAGRWLRFALYFIDYLIIGYDILAEAFEGIKSRQLFDECFLMAIATVGAMALAIYSNGDYLEAIAVMLFYQIGEWFQGYAVGKSRRNISELMDIRPDYANIEINGRLERIAPDKAAVGSIIVVQPGEKVPIDGVVTEGSSSLDTAALTGESLPREVNSGDEVISGCINMSGVLKIRTTKEFSESTVSKILDLVENASSRKSKSEDFITKFARIYTPAVCYAALALAVLPPTVRALLLSLSPQWGVWLYRALTFLVISCPCALVISIPLGFFAGIGGASKEGILIKGSNFLETLSKTDCVVFDKTGTLTRGVFEVYEINSEALTDEELLEYAALAESASSHPISKSLQKAYGKEPDRRRVSDIREISGNGVVARVDDKEIAVGSDKLLISMGVDCKPCNAAGTTIHIAVDGEYAGHIVISDVVKESSFAAITQLKRCGIKRTVMLTGDSNAAARAVAEELGVDEFYSGLLPAGKVEKVEELLEKRQGNGKLVFVGDGINDAPVLSRADIGIAMGAIGSDAAIEAADVVLMDDDPVKIVKAIRISRKCIGIVYQNIVFAIGVKLLCLVLGAAGGINMWFAIFADVGVMVLAVLNAIRALFVKKL